MFFTIVMTILREKIMNNFETWLKAQQEKGFYLEDAPSDGYSNAEAE